MTLIEDDFEDTLAIVQLRGPESVVAIQRGGELPRIRTAGHHAADVTPIRQVVRDQLAHGERPFFQRNRNAASTTMRSLTGISMPWSVHERHGAAVSRVLRSRTGSWSARRTRERVNSELGSQAGTSRLD